MRDTSIAVEALIILLQYKNSRGRVSWHTADYSHSLLLHVSKLLHADLK